MASVTIRISTRTSRGGGEIEMTADHVGQLLQSLRGKQPDVDKRLYDDEGRLRRSFTILVNGNNINFLKGLDTELSDGDEVYIMPHIAGG